MFKKGKFVGWTMYVRRSTVHVKQLSLGCTILTMTIFVPRENWYQTADLHSLFPRFVIKLWFICLSVYYSAQPFTILHKFADWAHPSAAHFVSSWPNFRVENIFLNGTAWKYITTVMYHIYMGFAYIGLRNRDWRCMKQDPPHPFRPLSVSGNIATKIKQVLNAHDYNKQI